MILLINSQSEPIKVLYENNCIVIDAGHSIKIPCNTGCFLQIMHYNFLEQGRTNVEKAIEKIAKSSILVLDSVFYITKINENAQLIVKNGIYEYESSEFGYLYFDIENINCDCRLCDCKSTNRNEVINMHRIVFWGECSKCPPFSILPALIKYRKIMKICNDNSAYEIIQTIMRC